MAGASDALEAVILNVLVGNSPTSAMLQIGAVGLNVGDPLDTGAGGGEASGGGYARQALSGSEWAATTGTTTVTTSSAITFPVSTGAISSGAALSHARFDTATTAGTFLAGFPLTQTRTVSAADITLEFAAGAIVLTGD